MDAFEQLVAELLWSEGYWAMTSVKVRLTAEDRTLIERSSCPAWELDVVGYNAERNHIRIIECKSYLDSTGVTAKELAPCEGRSRGRYKLFCEHRLRQVIVNRLAAQFETIGLCQLQPIVTLGLAVAKFKNKNEPEIRIQFATEGWELLGPDWLRKRLGRLSEASYNNQVSSVVAKLLLRPPN